MEEYVNPQFVIQCVQWTGENHGEIEEMFSQFGYQAVFLEDAKADSNLIFTKDFVFIQHDRLDWTQNSPKMAFAYVGQYICLGGIDGVFVRESIPSQWRKL